MALTNPVSTYRRMWKPPDRKSRSIRLVDSATHTSGLPILPPDYPPLGDPAIADYP